MINRKLNFKLAQIGLKGCLFAVCTVQDCISCALWSSFPGLWSSKKRQNTLWNAGYMWLKLGNKRPLPWSLRSSWRICYRTMMTSPFFCIQCLPLVVCFNYSFLAYNVCPYILLYLLCGKQSKKEKKYLFPFFPKRKLRSRNTELICSTS